MILRFGALSAVLPHPYPLAAGAHSGAVEQATLSFRREGFLPAGAIDWPREGRCSSHVKRKDGSVPFHFKTIETISQPLRKVNGYFYIWLHLCLSPSFKRGFDFHILLSESLEC